MIVTYRAGAITSAGTIATYKGVWADVNNANSPVATDTMQCNLKIETHDTLIWVSRDTLRTRYTLAMLKLGRDALTRDRTGCRSSKRDIGFNILDGKLHVRMRLARVALHQPTVIGRSRGWLEARAFREHRSKKHSRRKQ